MKDRTTGLLILGGAAAIAAYLYFRPEPVPPPNGGQPEIDLIGITWESGEFYTGSTHRATLSVRNPTQWDWTYGIYLGSEAFAAPYGYWSGLWSQVPLAAGASKNLTADITMVDTPGTYEVIVSVIERTHNPSDPNAMIGTFTIDMITLSGEPSPEIELIDITWGS